MARDSVGRRMFGRDSRLHAWTMAHPVRFGVGSGALLAVVLFMNLGTWSFRHPVRAAVGFPVTWAVFAGVFWLMTKARP
jgi:hypothetical protein